MCGVCGMAGATRGWTVPAPRLEAMTAALLHRGPDEGGTWTGPGVGIGARRLSVIDVAHGHQPMSNEDGSCVVAFNGEIYNADDLRADLEALGYTFRTRCDTEVVLRAYEAWDEHAVQRFNGMFAIAVWDGRREQLYLARDRVGIKPLMYTERAGVFAFSSELDSLAHSGLVEGRINVAALDACLAYLYVPHPETIYEGVYKLGPGEALIWSRGRLRRETYWRPAFRPATTWKLETAAEAFFELLRDSVRLRRISDVPLGAFLSGGIDSSGVTAMLAAVSDRPVKTFTIGFEDAEADETAYARMAAKRFGTDHTERVLRPDIASMASELIRYFGEPFADSSAIPTWLVSQIAREQVTVALSGDGGDELFAGYSWLHMAERVAAYRRAPETLRRLAGVGLALVPRGPVWDKVRRFQSDSFLSPMEAYRRRETCLGAAQRARLYTPEVSARLTRCAWDRFAEHWEAGAHLDERDRMLHQDLRMYLPDDILTKVDRMSMAVSLEARVPLLDHRIVELAGSIPFSLKYAAGESKRTPKAAFREMLPESLLAQRKRGFALPIQAWFRGELADLFRETVLREGSRCRMLFEESEVSRMFEAHIAVREDYGHALWALLQVEFWLRYADRHPELRVRL